MDRRQNLADAQMDPNKFDRRTHIWDANGNLIRKNLYTEYVIEGNRYLERPIGSGNLWTEGNQPAGRVEKIVDDRGHEVSKKFEFAAEHRSFSPSLEGDDLIRYQLEQAHARASAAETELAAIKAEREAAQAAPVAPSTAASTAAPKSGPPKLTRKEG